MTAPQNQDCPLKAGTIDCLSVKWNDIRYGTDTPCQHCDWWTEFCAEADRWDE